MARAEIEIFEATPAELIQQARTERLRAAGIRPARKPGPAPEFEPVRARRWLHRLLLAFRRYPPRRS